MSTLRIIVGAGGHGKSIASVAMTMGFQIDGFLDDNPALSGVTVCGLPVLGATALIDEHPEWELLAGIGSNRVRQQLAVTNTPEVREGAYIPHLTVGTFSREVPLSHVRRRLRELPEQQVGDRQAEHAVAEEFEALIARQP